METHGSDDTLSADAPRRANRASLPAVSPASYAIGRELARGGMGRVLVAEDLRIGRPVALKELLAPRSGLAPRFEREARVTARLQHPSIVPIYEIGAWPDGTPFYTMRMIEGATLARAIAQAADLDARLALLPSVIPAIDAVAFAHAQGVIHRDLKPDNIMLGPFGETLVIDWGLAKLLGDSEEPEPDAGSAPHGDGQLTIVGDVLGTAAYMAPEQASGGVVDERGDVYALGAILYQLLAGHAPYRGASSTEILAQLIDGPPPLIEDVARGAPEDLASIIGKAMARDPAKRYASARELVDELRRFQAGRFVDAHAYTTRERAWRWLKRHRALVGGAVAVVVALLATGVLWLRAVTRESERADAARIVAEHERERAERETKRTHDVNAELLQEQGRKSLLAGDDVHALAYFDAALQEGVDTPELRLMLGAAMPYIEHPYRRYLCPDLLVGTAPSHDGSALAVACSDGVYVYDLTTGARRTFVPQQEAREQPRWSSDDRWIAMGGTPAMIFDAHTGAIVRSDLPASARAVTFERHLAGFSTPAGIVVADASDRTAPLRVLATAHPDAALFDGVVPIYDEALAPQIRGDRLELFDVPAGKRLPPIAASTERIGHIAVSANHQLVMMCGPGGVARIWDVRTAVARATLRIGDAADFVDVCNFDARGERAILATPRGLVVVFDVASGVERFRFTTRAGIRDAMFADAHHAILIDRNRTEIEVRSEVSAQPLGRWSMVGDLERVTARHAIVTGPSWVDAMTLDTPVTAIAAPAGHRVVAIDARAQRLLARAPDGTYALWNPETGTRVGPVFDGEVAPQFAASQDVVVGRATADAIVVVRATDGSVTGRFALAASTSFGCDRACDHVFASDGARTVVWDARTQREVAALAGGARGQALSRDGSRIAVASDGLDIVDVATSRPIAHLAAASAKVVPVGFTASGRRLVLLDGTALEIFDETEGRSVLHEDGITSARFDETNAWLTVFGYGRSATYRGDGAASNGTLAASHAVWVTPQLRDQYTSHAMPSSDGAFSLDSTQDALVEVRDRRGRPLLQLGLPEEATVEEGELLVVETPPPRWSTRHRVVGLGRGVVLWDLQPEGRPRDQLHAIIRDRVPFRVDHGELLPQKQVVHGRVTHAGNPTAAQVEVVVVLNRQRFATRTKADGTFEVPDVPIGSRIAVTAKHGELESGPRIVDAGEPVELELAVVRPPSR